jgi:threonine 3-dehydrogenase
MLEHMNHGGKIAIGIPPANMAIDWNQVIFKGLEIKGIYGREMFETVQDGRHAAEQARPVADHRITSGRAVRNGVRDAASGKSGKVILDWTGSAPEGGARRARPRRRAG